MKLVGARGVDSPSVRRNEEHTAQMESFEKLTPVESISYRSSVAHVVQDRIDIAEAVKCLTRLMTEPRSGPMLELKRLGRSLKPSSSWSLEVARWCGELKPAETLSKPLPDRTVREWSEHVDQKRL